MYAGRFTKGHPNRADVCVNAYNWPLTWWCSGSNITDSPPEGAIATEAYYNMSAQLYRMKLSQVREGSWSVEHPLVSKKVLFKATMRSQWMSLTTDSYNCNDKSFQEQPAVFEMDTPLPWSSWSARAQSTGLVWGYCRLDKRRTPLLLLQVPFPSSPPDEMAKKTNKC